jgi:sirohydrochlorin ferrochelatase
MEQDQFLRRHQSLNTGDDASRVALLIAAHGERRPGADNEGVCRTAREVAARNLVSEVGVGFINGAPTIREAFAALTAPRVIVYPMFASSGYFTRDRLVQLLDEANSERAAEVARNRGFAPEASAIILLAHGSRRNSASREATEQVAREIENRDVFRKVRIALLEERPFLGDAAAAIQGPAIVVGLFSGQGMHGARDAPKLIAELSRNDIAYAGVIGAMAGIENLVARSVRQALASDT